MYLFTSRVSLPIGRLPDRAMIRAGMQIRANFNEKREKKTVSTPHMILQVFTPAPIGEKFAVQRDDQLQYECPSPGIADNAVFVFLQCQPTLKAHLCGASRGHWQKQMKIQSVNQRASQGFEPRAAGYVYRDSSIASIVPRENNQSMFLLTFTFNLRP